MPLLQQGESVYREAQQEFSVVSEEATRGFSDLRASIINRTRGLSLTGSAAPGAAAAGPSTTTENPPSSNEGGDSSTTRELPGGSGSGSADETSETVLERIRREGAKRLQDLQKAEEAADEALLKFGSNIRDFLQNAISIAPPSGESDAAQGSGGAGSTVLFEVKDAQGKRVIHTSRFDAQLHVIHTSTESFAKDPSGEEFDSWTQTFDIDSKTSDISADLAKYPELRTTMEKLVPDQVPYAEFWKRYYFLRHGIETAEARRRDLLKGRWLPPKPASFRPRLTIPL